MLKTFEYRLYPTRAQARHLAETLETCRHWYNQCLAERRDAYQLRGETIANPKWYRAEQAKLRVLQRTVARRRKGGSNRGKAVLQLQRQHELIANRRSDFLKKLVHDLVTHYDRIALEDLQVSNMVANPHLSKSILDAGWGYLKSHLAHKAAEAGRVVLLVNPAYTSKACSECGQVFENLTLADRWVSCRWCGASLDRDVNAALNILNRAGHARWGLT